MVVGFFLGGVSGYPLRNSTSILRSRASVADLHPRAALRRYFQKPLLRQRGCWVWVYCGTCKNVDMWEFFAGSLVLLLALGWLYACPVLLVWLKTNLGKTEGFGGPEKG